MTENERYCRWVVQSVFEKLQQPMYLNEVKEMFDHAITCLRVGEQPTSCFGCGASLGDGENPIIWHGAWILGNPDKGVQGSVSLYHCGNCAPRTLRRTVFPDDAFGFSEGDHDAWRTIHGEVANENK